MTQRTASVTVAPGVIRRRSSSVTKVVAHVRIAAAQAVRQTGKVNSTVQMVCVTRVVNVTTRTTDTVDTERTGDRSIKVSAVTVRAGIRVTVAKSTVASRIRYHPCRAVRSARRIVTCRVGTAIRRVRPF